MARTAKITNANVAPRSNAAGLVGNTPVRAQDFNDLAGDYISSSDTNAQTLAGTLSGHRVLVESVTANDSLTAAESGKIFVFADAAAVLTLPDSGAGDIIGVTFKFVSNFTATGQEVICADTTNEVIVGALINSDTDDDNSTKAWNAEVADGFSSVEFTGVAEGAIGSYFTLTCIAADRWLIDGVVIQEGGSEATPFAAS
jgi:hypothetical protein